MQKVLILVLLSLVFGLGLYADDYYVGDGTGNQNYVPLYGYSNYSWSKFFYTADELQAAGMTGTVQITKIAFNLVNTNWTTYVTDNQKIFIGYFYDSNYASNTSYPGTANHTQVYNGTITWTSPGWMVITLDAPYSHNSAFGMQILWENRDGSKLSGPPKFTYTNTSSNYRAVYKTSDSGFPTSTSGSRTYNRPNICFITPATDVPNPAILPNPADATTGVAITTGMSWSSGGGEPVDYLFSLWKTDPLVTIENNLVLTTTSYSPAAYLDYGTTYYWRVIPRNGFGPALDCPTWSFSTMADPSITAFPWTENFDGTEFPPTDDWQRKGGVLADPVVLTGSSVWDQDDWLNISGADQAAWINIWGNLNGWLITPLLNISDDSQALVFDLAFLKYNQPPTGTPPALTGVDDRFAVLIGDGYTWSTANIVREWNNSGSEYVLNELNPWGQKVVIPLTGHSGRIRIAFYAGSTLTNADNDFMINNLYVGPYLSEPLVSVAFNPDLEACELSWPAISGAVSYDVFYADAPNATWSFLVNTITPGYVDTGVANKRFYKVVAKNPN